MAKLKPVQRAIESEKHLAYFYAMTATKKMEVSQEQKKIES